MSLPDIQAAVIPVVESLEALGVRYFIGGSIGSSVYGIPRTTLDVDLIADLQEGHAQQLWNLLSGAYYIDLDAVRDSISRRSSFNLIHLATMLKVDVFVLKARPFDQESIRRTRREPLEGCETARRFSVASPEDILLNKLEWYRQGGEVSERQWKDVLGVLKVQAGLLDLSHLQHWSVELRVSDLLEKALAEADIA